MPDFRVCIERVKNGFEVSVTDPKIVKANSTKDKNGFMPYKDPNVDYIFEDIKGVLKFLEETLDDALPKEDYSNTFDAAAAAAAGGKKSK